MAPTYPYPTLTSEDNAAYSAKRRAITSQRDSVLAANQYGRFASQQRFRRSAQDLALKQRNARDRLQSPYLRRGLGDSGIWQRGLSNFLTQGANANYDLGLQNYNAARGFDLQDRNAQVMAQGQIADVEAQRAARIRELAAQLAQAKALGITLA